MEVGQHTGNGCTPKGRAMTRTAGAVVAGETGGVEGRRVGTLEGYMAQSNRSLPRTVEAAQAKR